MTLKDKVKIVFKNEAGLKKNFTITVNQLIDYSRVDLHELLEASNPCTSSGCNNESNNFCDCAPEFEDYYIDEILIDNNASNLQTVTVPPTDRPLKVGDVLVCHKPFRDYFTSGEEYVINGMDDDFINVIDNTHTAYYFFKNTDGELYYKNYFTLKP